MFLRTALATSLLLAFSLCALASEMSNNDILWSKYRHMMTSILSQNYCAVHQQAYPCPMIYATVFRMLWKYFFKFV